MNFVDQYRIALPSRGKLSIRMNSVQFDSLLVLLKSPLQLPEIAFDDDGGGGLNALISTDLNAGTYITLGHFGIANRSHRRLYADDFFHPCHMVSNITYWGARSKNRAHGRVDRV